MGCRCGERARAIVFGARQALAGNRVGATKAARFVVTSAREDAAAALKAARERLMARAWRGR
ncbi:MAG TPA: hypothetical protein PLJ34_03915 [Hyphomicrobiales bacterium]|nr:hypothetical protein [Candidatus Defluviicoccus seviourii]HQF30572.1 hypothetical protein [Hyphomicrobiales bacterium]